MKTTLTLITPSGEERAVQFPGKFAVCPRCRGKGTHVNPSIDGHGLTREDFDEDPDFKEAYFEGRYDVTCETCGGERVVEEVDDHHLRPWKRAQLALFEKQQAKRDRDDRDDRRTMYLESGGAMGSW